MWRRKFVLKFSGIKILNQKLKLKTVEYIKLLEKEQKKLLKQTIYISDLVLYIIED